ncbi:dihydroorotase [Nonomuraea sp. NPDC050663]|uniref:dihydroorotase n=1 Tax=Nonomuraea sp. NPDC050663 TaxID=3364370 RepID=UPI0037912606
MTRRLLRGVRPYGAAPMDVLIEGGIITSITPAATPGPLVLLPGFVDLHTHLREPGGEEAETILTGTRAAAAGGYTAVVAMANTAPVIDTPALVRRVLAAEAHADVHPVSAITHGLAGTSLVDMEPMAEEGVRVFSDDGRCLADPALMRTALRRAGRSGLLVAQHAQDPVLAGGDTRALDRTGVVLDVQEWPALAEAVIVARDVLLASDSGARLHICHVSTRASVEVLRWAKSRGLPVTAEVTPHHLTLTEADAAGRDPRYKMNPPLRAPDDVRALREALAEGIIDVVATDHAPHPADRKALPWPQAPFGVIGLETALPVVVEAMRSFWPPGDGPSWEQVARVMSTEPARLAGIGERHGRPIAVGEPAHLCLVDPGADAPVTLYGRSANTPFAGRSFGVRVVATLRAGEPTHDPDEALD